MKWMLLLLAACTSVQPQDQTRFDNGGVDTDFLSIVPMIIDTAEDYARRGGQEHATGPLMVDLKSFVQAAERGFGDTLSLSTLRAELNHPVLDVSGRESETCPPDPNDDCLLVDGGVYIEMDSAFRTPSGLGVIVTFNWNSPVGRGIDANRVRYIFERPKGVWRLVKNETLVRT